MTEPNFQKQTVIETEFPTEDDVST